MGICLAHWNTPKDRKDFFSLSMIILEIKLQTLAIKLFQTRSLRGRKPFNLIFNNDICTVVSPLKRLKAHKLIKTQLSTFVRVMYWYLLTLCQKAFSVNETVLILWCVGNVNYAFFTRHGMLQKYKQILF